MSYIEELFSIKDRVAIVTGAARGNGRSIAEGFRSAGAEVVAVDIVESIPGISVCDITDNTALTELTNRVLRKYGRVDIIVNNAGISIGGDSFENYSTEDWERTNQVNFVAPFELIKLVAPSMKKTGGGSIINITSLNAEMAFPNNAAYMASKGALRQLTKSAAYDLAAYNIRANNLAPGYMRTAMTEKSYNDPELHEARRARTLLGRWGASKDLIAPAIFLASDASSYITGQDLYVDGGWSTKGL